MKRKIESFINSYLKEIEENNAGIFAGAGLSVASGHVDWKGLLEEFADDLGLNIEKEHDLISLAQYHLNKNANNRHSLNQKIANEFHHGKNPNQNHEILVRLPIFTYWTTNYDRLIETSLKNIGKIVDVKYATKHLANTIHGRNAILYKMHGDVENPDEAIISKDQYEKYYQSHGAFINTLSGDLVSKTFLFIGFSFTDPNLDYILSRVRVTYETNQRKHYSLMREVKKEVNDSDVEFELKKLKQELIINDLLRFNIHVLLVKEYTEITEILQEIENRFKRKTIYISGSANEYGKWSPAIAEEFISSLSQELIKNNFKIVSGFGLGVGSSVISGVLKEIYINRRENINNQLLLRPFPQGNAEIQKQWNDYRKDMISYSGISIFIFGNKLEKGELVTANGVESEFDISKAHNSMVIPIGATGYKSRELWEKVLNDYESYFGTNNNFELFSELGNDELEPKKLIELTINFISKIIKN
ncbi:SIR2 family protein [Flavobacterium taihuense]|uniref:SIR2 family protein n=1 Tax=Flavobacterium taihuense TaxID=2857508 RepID=A0ABS6XRT6_9FLAO|nr:SIR2 family protein [Flavobacterium taihuense]MBW4359354.1 SIR2 family protein [Flavobacterium taihuense]